MAELVDAPDLGSGTERCRNSTFLFPTKLPSLAELVDAGDLKSPAFKGVTVRLLIKILDLNSIIHS